MANHYKTSNKTIAMRGQSLWETRAAFLIVLYVGCATDEVKLLVKSVCETAPKSLSCPPPPPPPHPRVQWTEQNNDIRKLKQGRRRRRRQRKQQKSNRFRLAKKQLCTCITLFYKFLCRHCMTTTWNFLISRFLGDVNSRQRLCFPFPELRHCPLAIEFNSREIRQHLTN